MYGIIPVVNVFGSVPHRVKHKSRAQSSSGTVTLRPHAMSTGVILFPEHWIR